MRKLAIFPASRLPTLSYIPKSVAGFFVNASNAFFSLKPACIALRIFVKKLLLSFKPLAVIAKLILAFSNAAALPAAISQCFKLAREINLASVGSSTSIACGKFMGNIKKALVAFISCIRWYSLPLPFMINCTPNSSPALSARKSFHLSLLSNICGNAWLLLNACSDKLMPSVAGLVLYHCASR